MGVYGGGKVQRLSVELCSARVVERSRGSVVGGSRREVFEASWPPDSYFVFVEALSERGVRFRRFAS